MLCRSQLGFTCCSQETQETHQCASSSIEVSFIDYLFFQPHEIKTAEKKKAGKKDQKDKDKTIAAHRFRLLHVRPLCLCERESKPER